MLLIIIKANIDYTQENSKCSQYDDRDETIKWSVNTANWNKRNVGIPCGVIVEVLDYTLEVRVQTPVVLLHSFPDKSMSPMGTKIKWRRLMKPPMLPYKRAVTWESSS